MSICESVSLFLALYAGFYSVALSTKEWFDLTYPLDELGIDSTVRRISGFQGCSAEKADECSNQAKKIKSSMTRSRFYMFLPTAIFFTCTIICTVLTAIFFSQAEAMGQLAFVFSTIIFVVPMIGCLILGWWFRREAFNAWQHLHSNNGWVPSQEEYDGLTPEPPNPTVSKPPQEAASTKKTRARRTSTKRY